MEKEERANRQRAGRPGLPATVAASSSSPPAAEQEEARGDEEDDANL